MKKVDKVYVVFEGSYSDRTEKGFFFDREEAEKYCALQNRTYNEWRCSEVSLMNVNLDSIKLVKRYSVRFNKVDGQFLCKKEVDVDYAEHFNRSFDMSAGYRDEHIIMSIVAEDEDHARKIAYDKLAEFKAYMVEAEEMNIYRYAVEYALERMKGRTKRDILAQGGPNR